jgi:thiamine biosynthesis lipoprotein
VPSVRYARGALHPRAGALQPAVAASDFAASPTQATPVQAANPASLHTLAGQAMGTRWSVRLCNPGFAPLAPLRAAIEDALALVVRQMSPWQHDADISRFNRAPAGTWQTLPPEFFSVLAAALHWARASGGAWDPTVGPLVDAWGFGPRADPCAHAPAVPDAHALARARARVGFERLALDVARRRIRQPGGLQLDLCGIAKGYAVDLVSDTLAAHGLAHHLVEVGGELRARGRRPGGQPWRVAVAGAAAPAPAPALALRDQAVATSGDQWHAFERGGRRYSHTIDPRSGEPVRHALAAVTVLHAECLHADALATVLTVLGPHDGFDFACVHGVAARFAERAPAGLVVRATPAFEAQACPS